MKKDKLDQLFDAIEDKSSPTIPGDSFDASVMRTVRKDVSPPRKETFSADWLALLERRFVPLTAAMASIVFVCLLVEGIYLFGGNGDLASMFDAFVQQQIGI